MSCRSCNHDCHEGLNCPHGGDRARRDRATLAVLAVLVLVALLCGAFFKGA